MRRIASAARAASAYSGNLIVYVAVGGASALVEWVVFALGLRYVEYIPAALAAFVVATLANYLLSRRFSFERREISAGAEIARTYVVSAVGLVVNVGTLMALVEIYGAAPMIGKIAGTGCGFIFNFLGRQFWVFAARPRYRLADVLGRWRRKSTG